eukprot:scaffold103600_cov38-Tisochrysis_lutea.AAC.4
MDHGQRFYVVLIVLFPPAQARAPPKPLNSEPVPEGEKNDWIDGINSDITRGEKKKTKKTKKVQ